MKKKLIKTAAFLVFGFLTMVWFNTTASAVYAEGDPIAELKGRLRQSNGEYTCRKKKDEVCGFIKTGSKLFIFPSDFAGTFPPGFYIDKNNNVVVPFNSIITFGEGEEETTFINF